MLVACLIVLCLAPLAAQEEPPSLDWRIERADVITVARVSALHALRGTALRLAELSLERVLFGEPELKRCFALPPTRESSKKANVLELGETYVLFLERWPITPLTKVQATETEALMQGAPLFTWAADGYWKIAPEGVSVPSRTLPELGGPPGVERGVSGDTVSTKELVEWLTAHIELSLPTIRVSLGGTGPSPWSFLIAPDRSIHGRGASAKLLEPAQWEALWDRVANERFAELPARVGRSHGPDEPYTTIEVRRPSGRTVVHVFGDALECLSPPERDAAERALRVLHALPIAEMTSVSRTK